jgi:Macrocin-O-methyltransferase (TylF)
MKNQVSIDEARKLYHRKDDEHWDELQRIVSEGGISFSETLINYPAFIRRREMTRLLADYDLFRMIVDLPGSIAELGVFLGAGLFTWSKLLETFVPGDRSRRVYGFESGGGYRDFAPEDGDPTPWINNVIGRKVVPEGYLDRMVRLTNLDNLIPGVERCRVIAGDILETVPHFAKSNQGTRLCLLFLDVNLYKPTLAGLRALYPLLVPGGVVALNGYGSPPWLGETTALEHYFAEIGQPQPQLRKLRYSIRPGGYFIKE